MVRTNDPQRPQHPPTLQLNTLPGDQYDAALRTAPTARPRLRLPQRVLGDPDELVIPIGPTGILVGAALRDDPRSVPRIQRDDMIMWALTDPQRATRVVMDTSAASIDKGKEFVMAEAALFIGSGEQARGREKLARKVICALVKRYRNRDSSVGSCVANT